MCFVCTGPTKPKMDDKKKKRPNTHATSSEKKKKVKIESTEVTQPRPGSMNEKDKEALKCWKEFKKASHMGRNGSEEDVDKMMMIQQQQLMRRQIEEQALVIANQQKIIQEQLQYIGVLKEQKQVFLRECQLAGLSTSDIPSLQTPSKITSQHFSLPPLLHMTYPQLTTHPLLQLPPSSPSLTVSCAPMSNPPPRPPSYRSHPPPPLLPHSHQSHLPHIRLTPGVLPRGPPPPPCPPAPCNFPGLPSTSQPPPHTQLTTSAAQPSPLHPLPPIYDSQNPSLPDSLTFSPLTSSEFREIDHKDQPPGYSALLMRSYDEELNSILDIAGLPTGRGAGYGVGVADDELPALDLRYAQPPLPCGPYKCGTWDCSVLGLCVWCLGWIAVDGFLASNSSIYSGCIRASVDALCRDDPSEISRDTRTKCLQTRRESLARLSKHTRLISSCT